jgi:hypothetical protein
MMAVRRRAPPGNEGATMVAVSIDFNWLAYLAAGSV